MFNLTLCIQGLNFLVAYLLLARFFFKPVLNVIEQQMQSEGLVVKAIEHCHETLRAAKFKKKQLWGDAYSDFRQYINFNTDFEFRAKACDRPLLSDNLDVEFDAKECDQLARALVDTIITRSSVEVK